ncbi:MAG: LysR substrate-binding domain-containing protein [Elainellaceae cyanobacterium]
MNRQGLSQLDFPAIVSFLEVAERGSFTDAAAVLNLAQPTVSQHIQRLERFFGVELLHRKPNGVFLSEEGRVLIQHCRSCLQSMQDGVAAIAQLSETVTGIVTLGLTPSSSQTFLSDVLAQYHYKYPQVHVKILEEFTDGLMQQIEQGFIDLAILSLPLPTENVTTEVLYEEPIVLAIGANHPIALTNRLSLNKIDQLPLVMHRQRSTFGISPFGIGHLTNQVYHEYQHRFHLVAEVKGCQSVRRLLLSNFGAAFLPYSLVQEDVESGKLVLIEVPGWSLSRTAVLIRSHRHRLSLAAEKLADAIRDRAHQLTLETLEV